MKKWIVLAFVILVELSALVAPVLVTSDSLVYFAAAGTIRNYGGAPLDYGVFPPIYPLLLSPFADVLLGARVINVVSFLLTVALSLKLLMRYLDTVGVVVFGLVIAFSVPLRFVFTYALSEPLFIAMSCLLLWQMANRSSKQLILLGLITGVLCLVRYIGLMFIPAVLVYLILRRASAKEMALYLVLAIVPVGVWMLRNMLLGMPPMGARTEPQFDLITSATFAARTLIGWWPAFIAAALVGVARPVAIPPRLTAACAVAVVLMTGLIIMSAASTRIDAPNDRLLSVVYIPALIATTGAVALLKERLPQEQQAARASSSAD